MSGKTYSISNLACSCCGTKLPLPRYNSKRREKAHIKDLWCYKCKTTTKHIEFRNDYELDSFLKESGLKSS